MSDAPTPPRSVSEEGTYWDRVLRIARMMDIRTAFVPDAEVDAMARELHQRDARGSDSGGRGSGGGDTDAASEAALQWKRRVVEASVHPDTRERISPRVLRLSFIVPANMTLDWAMISARHPAAVIASQWANQSYNALHYEANRNATNEDTHTQRLVAYLTATASSVGVALAMTRAAQRMLENRAALAGVSASAASVVQVGLAPVLLRRLAPFGAVAAADVLNLFSMRFSEWTKGINVFAAVSGGDADTDAQLQHVGVSRRAGLMAVSACVAGRVFAAAPVLTIPPLLIEALERHGAFKRRPWLKLPVTLGSLGLAIQVAVPIAFGLFKQTASVDVQWLEPEFRDLRAADGSHVSRVTYNKGL